MSSAGTIKQFIINNFLFNDDGTLAGDTPFIESGIMDSTGVLEMVSFIEESFGIAVEDEELIPENLDSIDRVAAFVDRKRSA